MSPSLSHRSSSRSSEPCLGELPAWVFEYRSALARLGGR